MTDQRTAALAAQLRAWAAEIEPSTPEADATMRVYLDAADMLDALSVRLAQECGLRAQAEQERDELLLLVVAAEEAYEMVCGGSLGDEYKAARAALARGTDG